MFDLLNLVSLAGLLRPSRTLYPEGAAPVPSRGAAVAMTGHRA